MAGPPKPLQLGPAGNGGSTAPPGGGGAGGRAPPAPLSLPQAPAAPSPAPSGGSGHPTPPPSLSLPPAPPPRAPHVLTAGGEVGVARQNEVERLAAEVARNDPALENLQHRLRPRIQRLLAADTTLLMTWGEENLAVAQKYTAEHAKISQRLSQLSVGEWVHRCQEASTRPPERGIFGGFKPRETPDTYEPRLRQLQAEMLPMVAQIDHIITEIRPELEDLRLDAAALNAVGPRYTDATSAMVVSNRMRTLVTGQQTAAMLLQQAETAKQLIVQNIQSLDQLLGVTLPAWRLSQ